jgi:pyridoxamine 5'-phosphate oxidase
VNALTDRDFTESQDPFGLFDAWYAEAKESEPRDPNAIALATVDADGLPDVRMVLLKDHDANGFVFYSNSESAKGRQLAADPQAAILLYWKSLNRQIRVRGPVSSVTDAESDSYFNSRHPRSRAGAIASAQSRPLNDRAAFEAQVDSIERQYGDGPFPRPAYWHGYRIKPRAIEFWQDKPNRLHDRIVFAFDADGRWTKQRLYP